MTTLIYLYFIIFNDYSALPHFKLKGQFTPRTIMRTFLFIFKVIFIDFNLKLQKILLLIGKLKEYTRLN